MSESKFENKLCPVCRKRFGADDEVVVCPDCGTPHHRACWNSVSHCALEEFHGMNYVWKGRLPDEEEPIKSEAETEHTEAELSDDPHHAEYPNTTPNQDLFDRMEFDPMLSDMVQKIQSNEKGEDGVSMRELAAYSATSVWHYARAFSAFRDGKKKRVVYFNFCSGLFAPIFQFYRRMDWLGILATLAMIIPTAAMVKLGGANAQTSDGLVYLMYLINIVIEVLLCLFGDYLYYRHAVKRILKIREQFEGDTESDDYFIALYESGRPSFARAALGMLGVLLIEACARLVL